MTTWRVDQRDARVGPVKFITPPMLLWTDPPYGTGRIQSQGENSFADPVDIQYVLDTIKAWAKVLHPHATICICCDYRLASYMVTHMQRNDWVYRGEVIWEFGLGRPREDWWPVRHNNVLTFTRSFTSGLFDSSAVPRAKRLAPKKGYTGDKAAGSVWELTMSNTDPERVGYPNQKPIKLIEPFVLAHTHPGDTVVDIFCGSGSTGVAAIKHGRSFYGCDIERNAVVIAQKRLANA